MSLLSPPCPHEVPIVPTVSPLPPRVPHGVPWCPRSGGLAEAALVARVNGTLQDLDRPLESDADLELLDFSTPEGRAVSGVPPPPPLQRVRPRVSPSVSHPPPCSVSPPPQAFWRSGACVLGAVAERFYGATLCSARATEDGFFCDVHMGDR